MTDTELTAGDLTVAEEPYALFSQWLEDAGKSEPNTPFNRFMTTFR